MITMSILGVNMRAFGKVFKNLSQNQLFAKMSKCEGVQQMMEIR